MALDSLGVQDCQTIQKTFEQGIAATPTTEAALAQLTSLLTTMRTQSKSFKDHVTDSESLASSFMNNSLDQDNEQSLSNISNPREKDSGFIEHIVGDFSQDREGKDNRISIFNSKCIPCDLRISTKSQFKEAATKALNDTGKDLKNYVNNFFKMWKQQLTNFLNQLIEIISMLKDLDKYFDICSLIKFLNDFVCIPDLQKIISALMALMMRVSFEIGGFLDLILALVGPLITPFLSGLVDLIYKYLLLVIRPIECIIDSIQELLRKLDYNTLFTNMSNLDKKISEGPIGGTDGFKEMFGVKSGGKTDPRGPIKIPYLGLEIPRSNLPKDPNAPRSIEMSFNVFGPIATGVNSWKAKEQAKVEEAYSELKRLENVRVDGANPVDVERHKEQYKVAKKNYDAAVADRDLSVMGEANQKLESFQQTLRSSIYTLVQYLKDAIKYVETFFNELFDELMKIMGKYAIGSGGLLDSIRKKLELVQMVKMIEAVIKALGKKPNCSEEENIAIQVGDAFAQTPYQIWTDNNGKLHIEENPGLSDEISEGVTKALGTTPNSNSDNLSPESSPNTIAMRRLESLIKLTGDPILDTTIAKMTEKIIKPAKAIFGCTMNTSVAQSDQVNKWIAELNIE